MACSCGSSCNNCRKSGGRARKRYNQGGLLRGPSHERGGMPAIIGGKEPVELEGGEYIIRKSSVDKYGEGTIAKINQGLIDPGKLRQLKKGGSVGRRKMKKGGRTKRKMQQGGGVNNPIVKTSLQSQQGQFTYRDTGESYIGPYHEHQDGTLMIGEGQMGVNHEIKPNEVIIRSSTGRNNMASRRGRRRGASFTGRQSGVRRASTRGIPGVRSSGRGMGQRSMGRRGEYAAVAPGRRMSTAAPSGRRMSAAAPSGRRMSRSSGYGKGGSVRKMHLGGPPHVHPHRARTMPQPRGGRNSGMCIQGTNQRYTGRTVNVGGVNYTTKGGAIEGNRKRLTHCQ
tara:strand:+ start:356 stop:1372 length:1017 start_codon:yes stop_codon:yes gene_type:complete